MSDTTQDAEHPAQADRRIKNNYVSMGRNPSCELTCGFPRCGYLKSEAGRSGGWCQHPANRVLPCNGWPHGFTPSVASTGGCNLHTGAAIRQAMGDDAAPTDRIGAALAAPGSERLRDYYATGPVQRASVETFVAALGVPSLQSVASAETCRDAAGVAPAALADANHQCDCSRHPPGSYCDTACTPGVAPSDGGRDA